MWWRQKAITGEGVKATDSLGESSLADGWVDWVGLHISEELWSLFSSQSVPTQNNQPGNGAEGHTDLEGKRRLTEGCGQGLFQESSADFYLSALILRLQSGWHRNHPWLPLGTFANPVMSLKQVLNTAAGHQ